MYSIQRSLDHQLNRSSHTVNDMARSMQGESPSMDDLVTFKSALAREAISNSIDNQMTQFKHSLSKSIIDSIN